MRTTLTLDDDILAAIRALAQQRGESIGSVISALLRHSLKPAQTPSKTRNNIRLFPINPKAGIITPELVKELLEETN